MCLFVGEGDGYESDEAKCIVAPGDFSELDGGRVCGEWVECGVAIDCSRHRGDTDPIDLDCRRVHGGVCGIAFFGGINW